MKLKPEVRETRYNQGKQAYELYQKRQSFKDIAAELGIPDASKVVRWFERIKEWEERNQKSWLAKL